jgi:hypothetical protein
MRCSINSRRSSVSGWSEPGLVHLERPAAARIERRFAFVTDWLAFGQENYD